MEGKRSRGREIEIVDEKWKWKVYLKKREFQFFTNPTETMDLDIQRSLHEAQERALVFKLAS